MTTRPSPDKRGGAALCCQCGNLRTSPRTGLQTKRSDPNLTVEVDSDPRGWRMTRTLECTVCEMPTVHARLLGGDHKDTAERWVYRRAHWMR